MAVRRSSAERPPPRIPDSTAGPAGSALTESITTNAVVLHNTTHCHCQQPASHGSYHHDLRNSCTAPMARPADLPRAACDACHNRMPRSYAHLASTLAAGPAHTYADGLARSGSCLVAVAGPSLCPGGRPAPAAAHPSAPHIIIKQTLHGHRIQSPRPRAHIIRWAGRGGGRPAATACRGEAMSGCHGPEPTVDKRKGHVPMDRAGAGADFEIRLQITVTVAPPHAMLTVLCSSSGCFLVWLAVYIGGTR